VLSDTPIAETTLLPTLDRIAIRRTPGALPSRAADNLFWLGRYVERTEATLRLIRALLTRLSDSSSEVVAEITSLVSFWSVVPNDLASARPLLIARAALQATDAPGSVPALANAARAAASVIRDRLSPDAWLAVTALVAIGQAPLDGEDFEAAMAERVDAALRIIASFSGLVQENMTRLGGWRFLELGRRIERGIATCRIVRQFGAGSDQALDTLLEFVDSRITYRQRYVMAAARAPVIDLAVLDPGNPRSIVFQLDQIEVHLAALPQLGTDGRLSPPRQIAMAAATALRMADATADLTDMVLSTESALMRLSDAVSAAYLSHVDAPEQDEDA